MINNLKTYILKTILGLMNLTDTTTMVLMREEVLVVDHRIIHTGPQIQIEMTGNDHSPDLQEAV